jgi:lipopolysaccharide transport system ATP-binding protein
MIVDEVLAVGDAEFQQKCLGKMGEVSKGEGRTILFVSHNMNAIKTLCKSGIYLKDGCIEYSGTSNSVIDHYLSDSRTTQECVPYTNPEGNETAYLKFATCINKKGAEEFIFSADDEITIRLNIIKKSKIRGIYGHLLIKSADESIIFETDTLEQPFNHLDTSETGEFDSVIIIPSRILRTGTYYVSLGLASSQENIFQIESLNSFLKFEVIAEKTQRDLKRMALTSTILKWENTLQKGQP